MLVVDVVVKSAEGLVGALGSFVLNFASFGLCFPPSLSISRRRSWSSRIDSFA